AGPAAAAPTAPAPVAVPCVSREGPGIPPPATRPNGIPGFHAYWYGQSGYMSLCPGDRRTATVAFHNSGSAGWVQGRMGQVGYLGTWNPEPGQDRASVLGGDGQRGSPATGWPRYDRVAVQPAEYVGPGQVSWFQFEVQAPLIPGTYALAIRPLIEGTAWLEDYGVFWYVTVLNPDGTDPPAPPAGGLRQIAYARQDLSLGSLSGARLEGGEVVLDQGSLSGVWVSPQIAPGFGWSELIPSWSAVTPHGTSMTIEMQATPDGRRDTRWWSFGRWADVDTYIRRTSVSGQSDTDGRVSVDTFFAGATPMRAYRLRITLQRADPSLSSPRLRAVGAVSSDAPTAAAQRIPSTPAGVVRELAVPSYSQEVHAGEYPEYDGGGEAWCSPTSTAMVMGYWGVTPPASELASIPYADPQVDHAARYTYDVQYRGTGNWSFNTAYAARYGLRAFVTQLRSLREAEAFIAAGIPLVASITAGPNALPGFLFGSGSAGHLLVISGFTASGDVVSHDPAALSNASVRRVYPRAAFERSWLNGSFGTVYVIHPASIALPPRPEGLAANW
ncbi:MAG: peptidase C39 family protein, partial [Chloroflexota bacterium]|nr:peptidase C39 family protein [Chloroflexota bacterium]